MEGSDTVATADDEGRYRFTKDYITPYVPFWNEHLGVFRGKPNVHFLEVGTFEGRTALWFLDNILTDPSSTMTCVDFFEATGYEARFDHNVAVSGHAGRWTKLKGFSKDVLPTLAGNRYDAIYIDGGHTAAEVYSDASLCWPMLKPGGIVSFDDYEWRLHRPVENRPQQGIDRFLDEHRDDLEILHKAYTLMARKTR
ncbi:class I SAM-dependent methyltransferase [Arvimicrobium flavum]|uniref:class I SAM-dependent methyltransferase n=1 Tax=Arvimicrobium flavum TaxID=3393320 RepID=UPI00237AD07E|nr:class I SAM-dependent methyltransferase [Mesorhizobium shangrilense]